MDYTAINPRPANLVKMDIFINGENVDALAIIAERSSAYDKGRKLVDKIKELIPRQLFAVAIQAGIGNKNNCSFNNQCIKKKCPSKMLRW